MKIVAVMVLKSRNYPAGRDAILQIPRRLYIDARQKIRTSVLRFTLDKRYCSKRVRIAALVRTYLRKRPLCDHITQSLRQDFDNSEARDCIVQYVKISSNWATS